MQAELWFSTGEAIISKAAFGAVVAFDVVNSKTYEDGEKVQLELPAVLENIAWFEEKFCPVTLR